MIPRLIWRGRKLIDVLFIETDKDKIDAFDPLEEQENEDGNGDN